MDCGPLLMRQRPQGEGGFKRLAQFFGGGGKPGFAGGCWLNRQTKLNNATVRAPDQKPKLHYRLLPAQGAKGNASAAAIGWLFPPFRGSGGCSGRAATTSLPGALARCGGQIAPRKWRSPQRISATQKAAAEASGTGASARSASVSMSRLTSVSEASPFAIRGIGPSPIGSAAKAASGVAASRTSSWSTRGRPSWRSAPSSVTGRWTRIGLVSSKEAQAVGGVFLRPHKHQVLRMTFDNGKEFAHHESLAKALAANGHCPSQSIVGKGSQRGRQLPAAPIRSQGLKNATPR